MVGADMYIGWRNSTGGVTIGRGSASGHVEPRISALVPAEPLLESAPSFSKLSFSFCTPEVKTVRYIYAGEPSPPGGNLDSRAVSIPFHSGSYGSFDLDLKAEAGDPVPSPSVPDNRNRASPILRPSSSFTLQNVYALHGILMFVAWCVSPFFGIFVARHLKVKWGHNWFRIHIFTLAFVTGGLSIAGFLLAFLYRTPPHFIGSSAMETSHVILGLIVMIGLFFQFFLGFLSDKLFSSKRTDVPWWDKAHWYIGRVLTLVAVTTSYLGVALYDSSYGVSLGYKIGFFAVIGLGLAALIAGQIIYGQVSHTVPRDEAQSFVSE
jgi:hypothetical protein